MSLVLQKNRQTLWASVDVNVDQTVPLKTVLCFPKWPQMKHEVLGFDVDGTSSCLSGIIRKNDCELFILITFTKKQNKTKKDTDVCWILWCTQINTAAAFSGAIIFPGNCYGIRWYKAIVSIQERQTTILCFPQTTCKNTCSSPTVWTVCLVAEDANISSVEGACEHANVLAYASSTYGAMPLLSQVDMIPSFSQLAFENQSIKPYKSQQE